jgi:hypothetical protein
MIKFYVVSFLIIFFGFKNGYSQTYLPGETYFGNNDYIEYKAGNLPIVISAPHGGILEPVDIPNRNCAGCTYVRDANTEDLLRKMYDAIFEEFGCYPHVIINRLHRRKLDANRAIGEAADGNAIGEQAWNDFQNFIELAKDTIESNFGKGLYLDLHGHGHNNQRLELGYRILKSELQLPDTELDDMIYVDYASIKNLVNGNLNSLTLSGLLRGEDSFGQLYENENFYAVPSQNDPYPFNSEAYFSGGYNTERHGSRLGGTIDGIQIECNMDGVRDTENNREEFAMTTAQVLKSYLEKHYFGNGFFNVGCGTPTSVEAEIDDSFLIQTYPNPLTENLTVKIFSPEVNQVKLSIYNLTGQIFYQKEFKEVDFIQIPLADVPAGFYFLKIESQEGIVVKKIWKNSTIQK